MGKWREAFDHRRPTEWDVEYEVRYVFGPPATQEEIARAEQGIGASLPADVRDLLCEFNGVWETDKFSRPDGRRTDVYLSTEEMAGYAQEYIRYGGDPPLTSDGLDLRKVAYVAQNNGFADLYGVCIEPLGPFAAGTVVRLDHETWALEAVFPSLLEFVERGLK
jgi:hypothetical protein